MWLEGKGKTLRIFKHGLQEVGGNTIQPGL